jgi:choice-of-anchor A domain-containing protein
MRHIEDDDTKHLRDIFDIVYLGKQVDELPTYTLEYILNGYNAVTLCPNDASKTHAYNGATYTDGDVYLKTHMMGGVLVRGDLIAGGGSGIADSEYANKPSFINGSVPKYNENGFGGANTRNHQPSDNVSGLYIGSVNTVYGNVVNGVESGNDGYNHKGSTVINDAFVDWDKLNQVVKTTSSSMAELPGTTITVDSEWQTITLSAGQVYYLDNPNSITHVKIAITNYNSEEGATATIINDTRSGHVIVPQVATINGTPIGFYEDKPEGVSIVFNYPNATTVDVRNDLSPEAGHVVAPNADMRIDNCNYNGCMVVNSLYSEGEGHLWPYKGDTLVPASYGFQLTKKLNGEEPTSSQVYTFMLQKWTGSGWAEKPATEDKNVYQEKDNEGSEINFAEITWTEQGTYFYLISEKTADDEYTLTDGTKFIVQVDVTPEQQGSATVFKGEKTYYKVDSSVKDLNSLIVNMRLLLAKRFQGCPVENLMQSSSTRLLAI